MGSSRTDPVAGRIPIGQAELLEQAAAEHDSTKAALVQRAVAFYIKRNPDEIPAFYPEGSVGAIMAELC